MLRIRLAKRCVAQRRLNLYERPTISTEPLWFGLGDTMHFLPVVKKLSKTLNSKIDIITQHPQVFRNNPYVGAVFDLPSYNFKIQDGNPYFFAPLRNKNPFCLILILNSISPTALGLNCLTKKGFWNFTQNHLRTLICQISMC